MTEKLEPTTRTAPSPATEPSAALATGITPRISVNFQSLYPGSLVAPVCSNRRTLPPAVSTSRTSGIRISSASDSAQIHFSGLEASEDPPRTVKSSADSTVRRPSIIP